MCYQNKRRLQAMTTNNFTLNYNVTGNDRKRLADKMAEILGCEAKYLGVPTFNYVVDYFTVDKSGTVIFDDRADSEEVENLIDQLEAAGFHAENEEDEDMTEVNVVVPSQELTAGQLRNIVYLAHAKQYLLNKVFGQEFWNIDDDLVQRLSDENPAECNDFLTIFEGFRSTCKGVSFDDRQVTLTYPKQETADKNAALSKLMGNMVKAAAESKRVNPKTVIEDNEKYYLRSWLLRVGFDGADGKDGRHVLLDGLKGHTAFRTPDDEAKWKAARAAARERQKAEQEAVLAPPEGEQIPTLTKEESLQEAVADAALIHAVNESFEE
jgi:hypothetical protein